MPRTKSTGPKRQTHVITVRLPMDAYQAAHKLAHQERRTMTNLIEKAIMEKLERDIPATPPQQSAAV